ncbi:MAG: SUMF1/EgtB/PvdO family nonheme iron enzyme [Deltaproteobacteria bacterium]|nr:SUMF1/EgtB/PvdO family nonheme iron enzyme [Deltaproteobacteria bacterium]
MDRAHIATVSALFALLVLCGCGGSSDGDAPSAGSDSGLDANEVGDTPPSDAGEGGVEACGSTTCGALEQCYDHRFCVAKLVAIPEGYSIDATEVTRAQYASWLATSPSESDQLPECAWATGQMGFAEGHDPPGAEGQLPVVMVSWCSAYAYCKGVGKRLCGRIGGGANSYDADADAAMSQWFNACSAHAQNDYPYGDTYDAQTCKGSQDGGSPVKVATFPGCQSSVAGYAGVYDLSGNAAEWEDSCSGATGTSDHCHQRGGSSQSQSASSLRCDGTAASAASLRASRASWVGFRCCSVP